MYDSILIEMKKHFFVLTPIFKRRFFMNYVMMLILYPINAYPMMTMDTVPTLQEFYAEMELLQEENTEESLLAAGLQF